MEQPGIQLGKFSNTGFDRGASLLKEAFWQLCKALFFITPIPFPSEWRVFLLRGFGAKIGEGVVIRNNVNISFPWRLTVGDHVWFGEEVMILSLAPVIIESNVCISQRAFLCTGSHDFRSPSFDLIIKPITVRESVWIAAQAFIGPGVEIGNRSMIVVGSVVTKDVAPGQMMRGNPAQVVKQFS